MKSVQYWHKGQKFLLGYYCQVILEKGLLSDNRAKMPSSQMNTSAGPHASVKAHLKRERRFHQAWHVVPTSPDLNPVDYVVCGALQQRVYHRRKFNTVEELHEER